MTTTPATGPTGPDAGSPDGSGRGRRGALVAFALAGILLVGAGWLLPIWQARLHAPAVPRRADDRRLRPPGHGGHQRGQRAQPLRGTGRVRPRERPRDAAVAVRARRRRPRGHRRVAAAGDLDGTPGRLLPLGDARGCPRRDPVPALRVRAGHHAGRRVPARPVHPVGRRPLHGLELRDVGVARVGARRDRRRRRPRHLRPPDARPGTTPDGWGAAGGGRRRPRRDARAR
jgi:hypothetical protein